MGKKYNRWLGDDDYDARLVKYPPADHAYLRQPQESVLENIPAAMLLAIRGDSGFFLGLPGEPGGNNYIGIPQGTEGNIVVIGGNGSGKSAGIAKPTLRTWQSAICLYAQRGRGRYAYVPKSGTSMATPVVAGAAALAFQKYPRMTNEECKRKLQYTASDLGLPWNRQGWGLLNVERLLG